MLLGASARKAALDFQFQAEFCMPSFLNLKADIYQISCQVPKETFRKCCALKELLPAVIKPLALMNSSHHRFIPTHFWSNSQIFLPLILFRLLVPLDTKSQSPKMKVPFPNFLLMTWGLENTAKKLTVTNKWHSGFSFQHWPLYFPDHMQTPKLMLIGIIYFNLCLLFYLPCLLERVTEKLDLDPYNYRIIEST